MGSLRRKTASHPAPTSSAWRPIETAPVTIPMQHIRVMLWSHQLGVCVGDLHRWKDSPATANVGSCHGDAVADWGVTHWMPLPDPPEMGADGEAWSEPND